jgi:hypothetical protein
MRRSMGWWAVLACLGGLSVPPVAVAVQTDPKTVSAAIEDRAQHLLADTGRGARPFAIVDKQAALIAVYRSDGSLAGVSTALLGQDPGDATLPGVGDRTQSGRLRPGDRTTPAGRFVSEPGHNRSGEAVVWLDYDAAFAIHRLRPGSSQAERQRRLNSREVSDKRVSAGCVVVPVSFFETVVQPLLGRGPALVEVLPEQGGPSVV